MRKANQFETQSGVVGMFGTVTEPMRSSVGGSSVGLTAAAVSSSSSSLLRDLLLISP
ncbi:hypothetical protein OA101_02445 [Alphaproteobacteria bacterium]|nr:hypothetical protein [Alphaproteobacteria bacterium]